MKILLGVCAGALLGALSVSVLKGTEVRRLETEVAALEELKDKPVASGTTGLIPGLSNALLPPGDAQPSDDLAVPEPATGGSAVPLAPQDGGVTIVRGSDTGSDGEQRNQGRRRGWSTAEGFEASVVAQRMRRAKMKQALVERYRLRRPAIERIDQLQQKLNDKLAPYGEEVSVLAQEDGRDAPFSTVLTLTQDVTGILAESQEELDEIVGEKAGVEDRETQVWNLIDLETFRPAAEALQARRAETGDTVQEGRAITSTEEQGETP